MNRLRQRLMMGAWSAGAMFLLLLLSLLFISDRELQGVVSRFFEQQGYTFRSAEFGKAFPLGFKARKLEIGSENGAIIKADEVSIRLSVLPLLTGVVKFSFKARIGAGLISGEYSPSRGGFAVLETKNLQLEDIPFFTAVTGATVKGALTINGDIRELKNKATGKVQLEVRGADLRGVKIGETPLPDAAYHMVRGMLSVKSGRASLESFTLQGDGIFVRLKGDIPLGTAPAATPLNLTLELMPKPEFLEKQKFVFLLLMKYVTSPGSYQIPIRGTLAKPSM